LITTRTLSWIAAAAICCSVQAAPPPAPSEPVTETLHGVAVADPFRNLENVKAPATQQWLQAQSAHAAAQLSRIDGRDAIAARIEALAKASGDSVQEIVRMPGERLYYLERKAGQAQFKLMQRSGLQGTPRLLLDPQALAGDSKVPHAINWFAPSWDGATLAVGVSAGGSENASLHLIDIASGRALRAPIERVNWPAVHWTPDSRYLAFNAFRELPANAPDTETFLDSTVFLLDRERAKAAPRALFGPLVNKALGLERLDVAEVMFAPGSRWMIARTTDTTLPEGKLFVAPLAALPRGAGIGWRAIATAADKIVQVRLSGDTLYLRTPKGAPRGQVLSLPLARPVLAQARVVVPEPAQAVLEDFHVGRDALYFELRQGFNTRVMRHDLRRDLLDRDIAPALAGSTFMVADAAQSQRQPWVATRWCRWR
jgi:prolyl oligopeptidase